jgi:hypothetical protein
MWNNLWIIVAGIFQPVENLLIKLWKSTINCGELPKNSGKIMIPSIHKDEEKRKFVISVDNYP